MKASSRSLEAVPVWDRFIRLFHWTLVSCVVLDYTVLADGNDLHRWLGYLAAALVRGIERNRREIMMPAMLRMVMLAHTLAPAVVDRLMFRTGARRAAPEPAQRG